MKTTTQKLAAALRYCIVAPSPMSPDAERVALAALAAYEAEQAHAPTLAAALRTLAAGVSPDMDSADCEHLRTLAGAALAAFDSQEVQS